MRDRQDLPAMVTIDFTPREIPPDEQERVQAILDRTFPGHLLVAPDVRSRAWLERELIDRGIPSEEVGDFLERHPVPFRISFPEDALFLSPPSDALADTCAALADPATAEDDCTTGSNNDDAPDVDADLRLYRVRRGRVDDGLDAYTTPTLPVVISMRDETVVAIT